MKLTFEIEPVEQARSRATRMGKGIRLYDPKKVSLYKKTIGDDVPISIQKRAFNRPANC